MTVINKAKYKRQKFTNSSDQESELSYEKSERQDAKKEVNQELIDFLIEQDKELLKVLAKIEEEEDGTQ
jgi:hypothetical protein